MSSVNPSFVGQSVTFDATVAAANGVPPAGTVQFLDNGNPLGTGTLTNGQAGVTTSFVTPGSHTITANYGGNSTFASSTNTLQQTVNSQAP